MVNGEGKFSGGEIPEDMPLGANDAEEMEPKDYLDMLQRAAGITNPDHGVPPAKVADQLGIHPEELETGPDAGENGDR